MTLPIILVATRIAFHVAAVSLLIRLGVWLVRQVRPGIDPGMAESAVLRFAGNAAGVACSVLVPARAIVAGADPDGWATTVGIVGLAVLVGWVIDLARGTRKLP